MFSKTMMTHLLLRYFLNFYYTGCFFNSDTFQMKKTGTKIILNTIMNYKLKTTYIDVLFHSRVYFVNFKICSK